MPDGRGILMDQKVTRNAGGWTRVPLSRVEDLSDAVYGAGLEAMQMSCAPLTGSLAFAECDGLVYSTGYLGGRVALAGPLSESRITFGVGLNISPGSLHWLNEVATGDIGVFLPGDDHDALYQPGSLYATVTLTSERLEETAERLGVVFDSHVLSGTGFHERKITENVLAKLRRVFEGIHAARHAQAPNVATIGDCLLETILARFARAPSPRVGRTEPRGHARIVARARNYVLESLDEPISIDSLAAAAGTSRRTLHRAFNTVLDETPQSFVRKARLHRIRCDLASDTEVACTVALVANQWGISELGRLSGWYRELFGELPSETLTQSHRLLGVAA